MKQTLIVKNRAVISKLCNQYKVEKLYVFGSALTKNFNSKSDIDLLVKFGKVRLYDYADNYFDLKERLEKLFLREVDLVEEKSLKNPYLMRVLMKIKN